MQPLRQLRLTPVTQPAGAAALLPAVLSTRFEKLTTAKEKPKPQQSMVRRPLPYRACCSALHAAAPPCMLPMQPPPHAFTCN